MVVTPDGVDTTKLTIAVTGTKLDGTANPTVTLVNVGETITGAVNNRTSTSLELTFNNVPGGSYNLQIAYSTGAEDKTLAFFETSSQSIVSQPSVTYSMSTTP